MLADARAAFGAGNATLALELAGALIVQYPQHAAALSIQANAAMQLALLDEADAALRELCRLRPDDSVLQRSHSRVLNRIGTRDADRNDLVAAAAAWREALQLWPMNNDAAFNLVLHGAASVADDEAVRLLQDVLQRTPDDLGARRLLAEIERNRGRAADAAQRLRLLPEASLRQLEMCDLILTLGDADLIERALPAQLALDSLVSASQRAFASLATLPDEAADNTLWRTLEKRDRIGTQSPSLRLALARHLSLPALNADRDSLLAARHRFSSGLTQLAEDFPAARLQTCAPRLAQLNWSNFLLAYQCEDDLDLQSRYGDWLCMAARTLRPDLADTERPRRPGPARIGLLSGHWNDSTAGAYFSSWIDALDVPQFDTRIYALGPRFDAVTDALERGRRSFVRLDGDIDRAAEIVHAADLDLLIYPEIGMDTRLLPIAALRLARRQWLGWGHPVTSGLPSMDGFLSCIDMEPSDAASHYRESLLLLPDLGTRYRLPKVPQRQTRGELGLPEGKLVVVPQSLFKIHPDNDAVLHELLELQPGLRILMFATTSRLEVHRLRQRLQQRLGTRLLQQIHFHPMVSRGRFLDILASADLMLDNLHWSGGNTSLDALRSGLPIATTRSRFMRGRQSAAMLQTLGLGHWIAADASGLATLARQMLQDGAASPSTADLEAYLQSNRPLQRLHALACEAVSGVV